METTYLGTTSQIYYYLYINHPNLSSMNEHPNMGLTNNRIIKRRKVLTGVSAVGVGMIAGCAETDNLDNNGSDDNESSEDEDRNQHDIGESFEIGSEGNSIRYVLEEATLAERIVVLS